MNKPTSLTLLSVSAIALLGLSGCDMAEQAVSNTVEGAKQSVVQTVDDAKQSVGGLLGQSEEGQASEQEASRDTAEGEGEGEDEGEDEENEDQDD